MIIGIELGIGRPNKLKKNMRGGLGVELEL